MTTNEPSDHESMMNSLSPGDEWPFHYRGYGLSVNPSGDVWWQAYNGTDRFQLHPTPTKLVDTLLELKRMGGAIRATENGSVITQLENETNGQSSDYTTAYVGQLDFRGELVSPDETEHAVPVSPSGLAPGGLWTSVYDGAKYSFNGDRFWWQNGETHLRHSFADSLPRNIVDELKRLRPQGGSFMITPRGDVLTQIPNEKTPPDVREQFRDLPRPIKRILKLRRDRGNVHMLPVYVGRLEPGERPIVVEEPTRLTDPLSEQEEASLEAWAAGMGSYEERDISEDHHRSEPWEEDRE